MSRLDSDPLSRTINEITSYLVTTQMAEGHLDLQHEYFEEAKKLIRSEDDLYQYITEPGHPRYRLALNLRMSMNGLKFFPEAQYRQRIPTIEQIEILIKGVNLLRNNNLTPEEHSAYYEEMRAVDIDPSPRIDFSEAPDLWHSD